MIFAQGWDPSCWLLLAPQGLSVLLGLNFVKELHDRDEAGRLIIGLRMVAGGGRLRQWRFRMFGIGCEGRIGVEFELRRKWLNGVRGEDRRLVHLLWMRWDEGFLHSQSITKCGW